MTKRIDCDLFARLMRLSDETRDEYFGFLGETPESAIAVQRRLMPDKPADVPRGPDRRGPGSPPSGRS